MFPLCLPPLILFFAVATTIIDCLGVKMEKNENTKKAPIDDETEKEKQEDFEKENERLSALALEALYSVPKVSTQAYFGKLHGDARINKTVQEEDNVDKLIDGSDGIRPVNNDPDTDTLKKVVSIQPESQLLGV
ncbi:unnamed protein product [Caenorhabditis sp. 36 PRJEB53466]|nr:unnamed protein product [Caenorhabditis sp. 36 PRJEB53466]